MKRFIGLLLSLLFINIANADIYAVATDGSSVTNLTVSTLAQAAITTIYAGKEVHISSALSSSFSNISSATLHAWPTDRKLIVDKGGSIGNTTKFKFATGSIDYVTPEMFGAKGDGITDDTAAVQRAVSSAVFSGVSLKVSGVYLCKEIKIDRPNDTTTNDFNIEGNGANTGFITNGTNSHIFTSSIAHTTAPVSEGITFRNIILKSTDGSANNYAVDGDKFLRLKFIDCYFDQLKCAYTDNYIQTYYFSNCKAYRWEGYFLKAIKTFYDVKVDKNLFEQGYAGIAEPTRGFYAPRMFGCAFTNNDFERMQGTFVKTAGARGIQISGNYFEDAYEAWLDFTNGGADVNNGVNITGNMFSNLRDGSLFAITYGNGAYFSSGNYTDGNLHDQTGIAAGHVTTMDDGVVGYTTKTTAHANNISATVTVSLTGCTTVPTATARYNIINNTATIQIDSLLGTSNTTGATITGLPAACFPARAQILNLRIRNNGIDVVASATVGTDGVIYLSSDINANAFTTSGSKGVSGITFSYNLQ